MKPTEHFGIYVGYIRRLFQGPFKFTETRPDSTKDVADARVTGVMSHDPALFNTAGADPHTFCAEFSFRLLQNLY